MTNSELFTAAHKLAKTFTGDYTARFVLALRQVKNGYFEIESYKGKKLSIFCNIVGLVANSWGKALSIETFVIMNDTIYSTSTYFQHKQIKIGSEMVNFAPLSKIIDIEKEFENKMNINQGLFGNN